MQLIDVKGVGEKTLIKLNKLGINTTEDLVRFMPKFYWDMTKEGDLISADHGDYILLKGIIKNKGKFVKLRSRLSFFRAELHTQAQKVKLVWFNTPYVMSQIENDEEYLFWGKLSKKDKGFELVNPSFEKFEGSKRLQGIVPIYPLKNIVGQQQFRKFIQSAMTEKFATPVDKYAESSLYDALNLIHFPMSMDDMRVGKSRYNLENLIIQYIAYRKNKNSDSEKKVRKYVQNRNVIDDIIMDLPYKLTESQSVALDEIISDLRGEKKTNRMLLGDVGSGKTVVALLSAMFAIRNGYQAAVMVPTEILAQQHYSTAQAILGKFDIRIGLLTRNTKATERKEILAGLKIGFYDLVIGTQAVLNDAVEFKNLSFIVIDELHRFGVKQKGTLEEKAVMCDVLSMSATPIPRAIALTIYGDLSISNLKPRENTSKISTYIMGDDKIAGMYDFIKEHVALREQAYIVCPLVLDSEGLEVYSAKMLYKTVKDGVFADQHVGLIYGSMKETEKANVMREFYSHNIQILIATSVVEVGIDAQDASIIAVLNSDRFGLATLHQLRGRVGRKKGLRSYCFLHTSKEEENVRLNALKDNKDGDAIAEIDASIRGYGDFLGIRQSGTSFKGDAVITKSLIMESKRIADLLLNDKSFNISDLVDIDLYLEKLQQISLN